MIRVNLTYTDNGVPEGFDPTPTSEQLTATRLYFAATTLKHGTSVPAGHNDPIGEFVDLKGNWNLVFQGEGKTIPILDGPVQLNTEGLDIPYAKVWNFPDLNFLSALFPSNVPLPYVTGCVIELQPNGEYEGLGSAPYWGTAKYNMRSENASYEISGTAPTLFKRTFIQFEVSATTIKCYHDGVLKGSIANDLAVTHSDERRNLGLLVPSNNSCWNVFAFAEWAGSDYVTLMADFDNIAASFVSKFNCGQMNPKPHATDLTPNFNAGTRVWTASLTAVNATDDQISNATYMWLLKGVGIGSGGFFNNQRIVGGSTNTLNESDYLSYPSDDRIQITPYVSIGGYDFIKGETKDL